ncbi:hypothetical protein GCM10022225_69180 [Plantactinospora mayteni]|uniref:Uncharacterized protein n=1 Tax=Plantactinospora mayteni TaxID=566021 RepID=A0ABQ4F0S2_9ACTN|nr:hypothetical protein Pma05_70710 [Plantactinospora mayteni]
MRDVCNMLPPCPVAVAENGSDPGSRPPAGPPRGSQGLDGSRSTPVLVAPCERSTSPRESEYGVPLVAFLRRT